jgi:N,N'-diacetyllegionaminate synthase
MPDGFELEPVFLLENTSVGIGKPVFIIAELGVNHNGDPALAEKMIDEAVSCGANCVKFQTFHAEEFMADRKMEYQYTAGGQTIKENMFDMFKRLELTPTAYQELFRYARRKGAIPLTSTADPQSVEIARGCASGALKLSSEDLINLPLVDYAASTGLPLLLSTGMADATEILDALDVLQRNGARQAVFLHCVSVYPTPVHEANLNRIKGLQGLVCGPVGYSDHTEGVEACLGAVALGACVIEKHFTLDNNMQGPDHFVSADPKLFRKLVNGIRTMEALLGSNKVGPAIAENESRKKFRRSVVAASDLPAGHILRREDLALKRPGVGLRARDVPNLIEKRLRLSVKQDEVILLSHIDYDLKEGSTG